ncbi:hypothetical protein FS837_009427 [Tulasnella sp. UAMH 9824]|nr:hypothetical protein FS837_009427 [Tulasnella sp. UAMH 9824]
MAPSEPAHRRTPLRRISHGSLSNLARSASQHPSESDPTRLNFLLPAFADLADEMASLHANLEKLNDLSYVLETFNESFASYLYALRMNAFCVEWEQAPGDTSFILAAKAAEEARAAISSLTLRPASEAALNQEEESPSAADQTYATEASVAPAKSAQAKPQGILKNATSGVSKTSAPAKKAALTAKEKKARDAKIDRVINVLPLEFRGNDPDLRKVMEGVIGSLMDNEGGLRIAEIAKPPLLPQVKVNKCLIALVGRKVVEKETTKGAAIYHYRGIPDR